MASCPTCPQPPASKQRRGKSTNPNQWPGLILSSTTIGLLMEEVLLPLHRLSNASAFQLSASDKPNLLSTPVFNEFFCLCHCIHSICNSYLCGITSTMHPTSKNPKFLAISVILSHKFTRDETMRIPSVFSHCWLGDMKGMRPTKISVPLIPKGSLTECEEGKPR